MKQKLLSLALVCFALQAYSQCQTPPPPGLSPIYALDTDNDGIATFDIAYYITYVNRPLLEETYGVSSTGYDAVFTNIAGDTLPMMYNNVPGQVYPNTPFINFIYNGNGPTFDPLPPCYWPPYLSSSLVFFAIPYDQDFDNDGILNRDEDTNQNNNLMDDDDDHDGIINLKDPVNNLAIAANNVVSLSVYPNPVTNGIVTFECDSAISSVTVYDLSGKQLYESKTVSNTLDVEALVSGVYFLRFNSEKGFIYRKIIISR